MKSAGAEKVAFLHGGFKGWLAGAYPTVEAHLNRAQSSVDVAFRYDWWADPIDILAVSTKQTDGAILDSRLDSQVRKSVKTGKPMMSMPIAQYIIADFFAN
ncbi:MAG: hypothetical protein OXC60_05680 [Litoreibacter sp.]|nr:hypothetical protein [Litoreibacter sp.]MCY4334147.1 hypothetical protein [Litoreibacter sp.]